MKKQKFRKRNSGMATMDVVFVLGALLPICLVLYYVAEKCLSNLYQVISVTTGSPVM